jgi:hypothetical protein
MSCRISKDKGPDVNVPLFELYKKHLGCVDEIRSSGFFDSNESRDGTFCMDCFYNSNYNVLETGVVPIGLKLKSIKKLSDYTSIFYAGNTLNGQVLPTIVITTDPKLQNISKKMLLEYGVLSWQIVYAPPIFKYQTEKLFKRKDGTTKVETLRRLKETSEFTIFALQLWLKNVKFFQNEKSIICGINDGGGGFKIDGNHILEALGIGNGFVLESKSHVITSTLDNGSIGPTKHRWRAGVKDGKYEFTDEPRSTLELIKSSQAFKKEEVKGWWNRNFLMDYPNLEKLDFNTWKEVVNKTSKKWAELHEECKALYQDYVSKKRVFCYLRSDEYKYQRNTGLNGVFYDDWHQLPNNLRL